MTLFILTGASGAGKTSIANAVASISDIPIDVYNFDSIGIPTLEQMVAEYDSGEEWQKAMTLLWMKRLALEKNASSHILLEGQMRFSFIEAAAIETGIEREYSTMANDVDEIREIFVNYALSG